MAVSDDGSAKGGNNGALTVSKLTDAASLCRKFDQLQSGRSIMDRQWRINLAFYKGRQYVYWNKAAGRIEELPTGDGDKPRFRIRITSNQIVTGARSLQSKLTKTKPQAFASPASGDREDLKAAQMSDCLLEHWWDDFELDDLLAEAVLWSIIAGQGWWHICWDKQAGKPIKFTVGPDGQPINNEALRTLYLEEVRNMGLPVEQTEKTLYMGDIRVEALSPFQVFIDPAAKTFSDANYAIIELHMDPDAIKGRWGVDVQADAIPVNGEDAFLSTSTFTMSSEKTTRKVYLGLFKPTPMLPQGRVVYWLDGPKQILEDAAWEYPTHELPLVKFPGVRVPGQVYDDAVVTHAIDLQKELNRSLSQIVEYKNLTIKPRVWAPVGSLRTRLTNEPGAIYEFTPVGGLRPEVEEMPAMPPYLFDFIGDMGTRIRDVFDLTEVSEGTLPPNVEAATAIELLQEMSVDRIEPQIRLIEKAVARAGRLMLGLAQQYYIEPRLLKIRGTSGSTQVSSFTRADLAGGVDVKVEKGSGMPRLRAARQARIEQWVASGVLTPMEAKKHLDVSDLDGIAAKWQADEDMACREHEKLLRGEPINTFAMQAAMQAVQTPDPLLGVPVNPQTGQPFQSPQEMQAYVMDAGFEPLDWENFSAHVDVHSQYMKSIEFEQLPDQAKQAFLTHYQKTYTRLLQVQAQSDNVKTTLQIKSTAGPTATAEVLHASGVRNVTPEMLKEAPLETWFSDDADKPNAEPMAQNMIEGQKLADQQALTAQKLTANDANDQRAQQKHDQALRHADQAHKAKLQAQKAKAKQRPNAPKR